MIKTEEQHGPLEKGLPPLAVLGDSSRSDVAPQASRSPIPKSPPQEGASNPLPEVQASKSPSALKSADRDHQSKSSAEDHKPSSAAGIRHIAYEGAEGKSQEGSANVESVETPENVPSLAEKLPTEASQQLKEQWEAIKAAVERLKHVESFSVVTIVYRK